MDGSSIGMECSGKPLLPSPSSSWVGCDIHASRHGQQPMDGSRRQVGASHWLVPHHIGAGSGFRDAPVASVGRTTIVYSSGSNNPPADPWSGEPRSSVSPRHRQGAGERVWLQEPADDRPIRRYPSLSRLRWLQRRPLLEPPHQAIHVLVPRLYQR